MDVVVKRWVPRAAALAVAGIVAWPSLSALFLESETKQAKPPEAAIAAASPPAASPPKRDPFDNGERIDRPAGRNYGGKDARNGVDIAGVLGRLGKGAAAQGAAGVPVSPLSGLHLEATCIMGDRRLALINGRLYAPQETITAAAAQPGADAELAKLGYAPPPSKVVDVLPYKVLLSCQGKTMELTYSDSLSGSSTVGGKGAAAAGTSHPKSSQSRRSKK
ncbi:MAG: hypothetical protein LLG00_09945 [Planctomycetaceae bacterium]|nr:hypothetical protein [Planctomycetaceae bacterium]